MDNLQFISVPANLATFEAIAPIEEAVDQVSVFTPENRLLQFESRVGDNPYRMFFVEFEGKRVGYGMVQPNTWVREEGLFFITIRLLRIDSERSVALDVLKYCEENALQLGAKKVACRVRSTHPAVIFAVENSSYECIQKDLVTAIDLTTFDPVRFLSTIDRVHQAGIEIVTIQQIIDEGKPWTREAYELNCRLIDDVEIVGGAQHRPFKEFEADLLNPTMVDPVLNLYARKDGRLVGETGLYPQEGSQKTCLTGLTGVLKEYRRMGIATALKVESLRLAQLRGFTEVSTGNERTNPMYRLNLELGYKDCYEDLSFMKSLTLEQS